jgi:glycine/D-amino acid oxidase-like deaminating enzyme
MQRDLGAVNELLEPEDIMRRFPSLDLDGVALGSFGPEDGWMDPHAILQGFRKKATALGAHHITGNARSFEVEGGRARAVVLDDGRRIEADHVVCAAGAWSAPLLATAGD